MEGTPTTILSVAWVNRRGNQSRTHYTTDLNQAVCSQYLHEKLPRGATHLWQRGVPSARPGKNNTFHH